MTRTLIMKVGLCDLINGCVWTADVLREAAQKIGQGYRFDEVDQCVYWEGDKVAFLKEFREKFPWSKSHE